MKEGIMGGRLSGSGAKLKRADSLPAHLPSNPLERPEVKPVRKSITRPAPDTMPPTDFQGGGDIVTGSWNKMKAMELADASPRIPGGLDPKIEGSPYYMGFIKSVHPKFESYSRKQKEAAYDALASSHPRLMAEIAKERNESHSIPSHATANRSMTLYEQKFLTRAFRRIKEDVQSKPFHIHGESGIVGNKKGEIVRFDNNPAGSISINIRRGDKYHIHTHPPFVEPFTSSVSGMDHMVAADMYSVFNNRMNAYVTNGKDVLHIQPASLELVKLKPDADAEMVLGKFPEAFRLPDPQQPPKPFSNHEAPAAFKKDWEPPAGWTPPEDYPRG